MNVNETVNFNYTGNVQSITLLPGRYKLQAWGAQGGYGCGPGGTYSTYDIGGLGGYAFGEIVLTSITTVYVYVGEMGHSGRPNYANSDERGGWNGGGNGSLGGGGGGATDIRLSGTSLNDRIIVAGAGGGASIDATNRQPGGAGGGLNGYNGVPSGIGATQSSGYALGQGGSSSGGNNGGGGGGYYGGYAGNSSGDCGGGGGSSYIARLVNAGTQANTRSGHGMCSITCISIDGIENFQYTGKTQAITLDRGVYEFYCRGAQGGNNGITGSISKAKIVVIKTTTFYVNVGGTTSSTTGGWNGGGNSAAEAYGGGGSTDIAVQGTNGSTAWNNTQHLNSRIIMAAGGTGKDKPSVTTPGSTTGTATATRADGRSTYTNRYGGYVMEIIPKTSGQIYFQSTNYSHDPYGFIDDSIGTNLISNDDSGRPITGHQWDFMMRLNVEAGKKYMLRVGSFSSSLGTTGWATWYATYPNSSAKIYNVMTTQPIPGGVGGGLNYIYTKSTSNSYPVSPCNCGDYYMYDPVFYTNASEATGNGYAYILKIGDITEKPLLVGEYYYNGNNQTATLDKFDNTTMTVSNNVKTNAGTYTITISLKSNYYWDDGTNNNLGLTWVINKIDPEITWPIPTPISKGTVLSKSKLKDGVGNGVFQWSQGNIKVDYPNHGYEATFIPIDTINYNTITKILLLHVFTRNNSNFYKDTDIQEHFDFNKL